MGTQLIQVVAFENVAPGQHTLPHNLNVDGRALVPDIVMQSSADFSIDAVTSTEVTVTNTSAGAASCNVWLEFKHTTQRWFGAAQTTALSPNPFVPAVGGGGGGGGSTVDVQDEGVAVGTFTTLNFTGAGVTATDGGGGVADIAIPGGGGGGATPGFVLDANGLGGVEQNNGGGNAGTGANSMAGGLGSSATGAQSIAIGDSCVASGDDSVALGSSSAEAAFATALGSSNALEQYATASGNSNVAATSTYGTALGNSNVRAASQYATALGNADVTGNYATGVGGGIAQGEASFAAGWGEAHAEGAVGMGISVANGTYSTALGSTTADGDYSTSMGVRSSAPRESQLTHASGRFAAEGDAQWSQLELRGATDGVGANESIELAYGDNPAGFPTGIVLDDGHAYNVSIQAVAYGFEASTPAVFLTQSWRCMFSVRKESGVTTIAQAGTPEQIGDAGASGWTLTASVGAAPDRFVLTFETGAGTVAKVRCVAKVEFVEVVTPTP